MYILDYAESINLMAMGPKKSGAGMVFRKLFQSILSAGLMASFLLFVGCSPAKRHNPLWALLLLQYPGNNQDNSGGNTPLTPASPAIHIHRGVSSFVEDGGTGSYTVVLNSRPDGDVIVEAAAVDATKIQLSTDGGATQAGSLELTFTTEDYNTPQTVTVIGVDDGIDGPIHHESISHTILPATSDTTGYAALTPDTLMVTPVDTFNGYRDDPASSCGMLRIGDRPEPIVLEIYQSGGSNYDLFNDFGNKTTLISFIDINNAWSWTHNMVALRTAFPATDLDIIAVLYDRTGAAVTGTTIDGKMGLEPFDPTGIIVLIDPTWSLFSAASLFQTGFNNGVDPSFNANTGDYFWSYLVSEDFVITDKWHLNTTTNGDPISFNQFEVGGAPFDSSDWSSNEAYVAQRIQNLLDAPRILSATPTAGSSAGDLSRMQIAFSKPVGTLIPSPTSECYLDISPVREPGNYTITGSGAGDLSLSGYYPVLYEGSAQPSSGADSAGRIENVVTLDFSGNATKGGSVQVELNGITDTAGNALTDNTVQYNVE